MTHYKNKDKTMTLKKISTKTQQSAIHVILHRRYFGEVLGTNPPMRVRFISFEIEDDDDELIEMQEETQSYLVQIGLYDEDYFKIATTFERIDFDTIKNFSGRESLKIRYKKAKISMY